MPLAQFHKTSLLLSVLAVAIPLLLYAWTLGVDEAATSWTLWALVAAVGSYLLTRHGLPRFLFEQESAHTPIGRTSQTGRLLQITLAVPLAFMVLASVIILIGLDDPLSKAGWMVITSAVTAGKDVEGLRRLTRRR